MALAQLKRFFEWLLDKPGCKSQLQYSDAEYFNLSDNDTRVATAQREQKVSTLEQIRHVIKTMPTGTVLATLRRMGFAKEEMSGHGFRAMASTILHEQGWPSDVNERQLAHTNETALRLPTLIPSIYRNGRK